MPKDDGGKLGRGKDYCKWGKDDKEKKVIKEMSGEICLTIWTSMTER